MNVPLEWLHLTVRGLFRPQLSPLAAWRAPGYFPNVLLETHWAWWIATAALGILASYLARQRNDPRLAHTGQIILIATLLWFLAAQSFDTPAERLHNAHVGLARAVTATDIDQILSYLAPDFTAPAINIQSGTAAKEEISARLKDYGIKDTSIRAYTSALNPDHTAYTTLSIITQTEYGPIPTTWDILWNDLPNQDWKIASAHLIRLAGNPVTPRQVIP